jgi:hypothetical protein
MTAGIASPEKDGQFAPNEKENFEISLFILPIQNYLSSEYPPRTTQSLCQNPQVLI